ncbi:Transforming growth factor beta receptor type 3 [Dissostichus eleginoides]|uniref:Transforming growth factor beta receptor type 3 n=1 Tax=Dissostichus eleginoides TaxID=100907 RepID=A0AAD9B8A4_DISEL|nr:Transforming growth factor beta receptor type 3 [Dissostichus eleginoides]
MLHEVLSMPSLSGVMRTLFCLLLWNKTAAQSVQVRCSVGPVGALHPVQGRLERFDAGPGCAARERGDKETHVIAVGRVTNSPENKVTVLLKPFSLTPLRNIHLLLSSKIPVSWWLEAEKLPPNVPVLVQVSSNSSVHTSTLHLNVQTVHSLPFHPRALHRWALKHHGNLSSFTHTTHGNRVYVPLGEDPSLPAVCQLQSVFLSNSYVTSDLQTQEVQGCSDAPSGGISAEVHVIKLHSAGSGLCGSLQVEVIVSLLPLKVDSRTQMVVLILSSSVPVNWAIHAPGVRGQVSVYSSHSVSPPYPSGHPHVTSYTEADLANRFVIQLSGGGTDVVAVKSPVGAKPRWAEERRLRQWLSGGGRTGGREIFTVQCEDGRLSVSVDQHILQSVSVPVVAVTLRDSACQGQSNGSHFLLVFPVISCGTEGVFTEKPRGVQYKNIVLLWRADRQSILTLNETELKSSIPLSIPFSCLAGVPPLLRSVSVDNVNSPEKNPVRWETEGQGSDPGLSNLPTQPRNKSWPVLILKLFVTESYEQRRIGPCVITADQRVYVEISAKGSFIEVVEVKSCAVSPLSDSKKSPFWSVISDGCSSDQSLTLTFLHCSLLLCTSESRRGESTKETGNNDCEDEQRIPPLVSRSTRHQCEIRNLSRPMVVTVSISSLAPKPLHPPAGTTPKRLTVSSMTSPDPEHSSAAKQTGMLMGVVFIAFVMGASLMGGIWCIYKYTGARPASPGRESHLTANTPEGHTIYNPLSAADQSSSSM